MGQIVGTLCMHGCVEPTVGSLCVGEPYTIKQLTAEMLTNILQSDGALPENGSVKAVKSKMFGEGEGLLSVMHRLELSYGADADPKWPTTLVAKLGPPAAKTRIIGAVLGLFEAEVNWYLNQMPEKSGVPAPKVYYAAHGGYGRFVLIMEDMAPARVIDQHLGATQSEATTAVKALAKLHARYRGRVHEAVETRDWVRKTTDEEYAKLLKGAYHEAFKTLDEERYAFFGLEMGQVSAVHEVLAYIDETYDEHFQLDEMHNSRPASSHAQFVTTLCHGDFRGENVFISKSGGVEVIDYQLVREGQGAADLNYFIQSTLATEARRQHEMDLLRLYLDEMRANGCEDLTATELLLTYQRGLIMPLLIFCIGQKDVNTDSQRGRDLIKLMAVRLEPMLTDWQFLKAIKLRDSKQGDDGVTSTYSPEEVRESLPPFAHVML